MSFRLFIYYCALCGGWAGFLGWALGLFASPDVAAHPVLADAFRGMWAGLLIALALGLVDALWNLSLRNLGQIILRVGVAVLVGLVGGFLGGMIAQWLLGLTGLTVFFVLGWTLVGLLVGGSIAVFEVLASADRPGERSGAVRKMTNGLIGGTAGGLLGGFLALLLRGALAGVFHDRDPASLWSPTATGLVALGLCIGLLIGLAQVILKEAWIRVEAGFRAGRELILSRERTTVGRAESCDVGLFGDPAVEKFHANIILADNRYHVEDARTPGGTFLNDQPVAGRTPLRSGDLIRVGRSLLRFRERQKRRS
jgi:hypothetical protein